MREVVYNEVAEKLRAPLHVRSAEQGPGSEVVYGAGQPGRPVYLVKDSKDLFTRVHEDGTPFAPKEEPMVAVAVAAAAAPRSRKPRPSGGAAAGGGQSARDKERDATWEVRGAVESSCWGAGVRGLGG